MLCCDLGNAENKDSNKAVQIGKQSTGPRERASQPRTKVGKGAKRVVQETAMHAQRYLYVQLQSLFGAHSLVHECLYAGAMPLRLLIDPLSRLQTSSIVKDIHLVE